MGLTATFEEGIAVFVAIGTTVLAAIHSNEWLLSECINVATVCIGKIFGTLHAAHCKQADCFTESLLSKVPLYYILVKPTTVAGQETQLPSLLQKKKNRLYYIYLHDNDSDNMWMQYMQVSIFLYYVQSIQETNICVRS